MIITICDVDIARVEKVISNFGGEIVRNYKGLCNIQFKDCRMTVHQTYVEVFNPKNINANYSILFDLKEFSNIYID